MLKSRGAFIILITMVWTIRYQGQSLSCQASKQSMAPIYFNNENLRSDTFDILKYTINLEIGNTGNQLINGHTVVKFAPKISNRTFIRLDLLKLNVDSIKENNTALSYTYNDTVIKVNFTAPKNIADTSAITVFYKGQPQIDGTGWGGFYFDNTQNAQYAYNLGVGFGANPHNYGRVWFPCFDNFVEHSKYEFVITSDSLRRAYCGGELISDVVNGAKRTRTWRLEEEIPTYLASVSLANYRQVNWTINTITGVKPITLVSHASDTIAMKNGFVNLKNCITGFENYFGPYLWNRFGYCLVPFSSGAMEHATNITYPRLASGNLLYEDLMAHELSHHWWGNLVTCETPEDMWINEGMATFSSYMFLEWQYGKAAYLNKVKTAHDDLLHFLHKREKGFRAISGVPHDYTYSSHVYTKGADVAHTLRGYMGDSAFFAGAKFVMQQKQYENVNSVEFRDLLQISSGQNLTQFFSNWVLIGGWPHFSIDSVNYIPLTSGGASAEVHIKQKLFGATTYYSNVPLELSFIKPGWPVTVQKVMMSGATGAFSLSLPFLPDYCGLNYGSKISDATSHEVKVIKTNGNYTYSLGKMFMVVTDKGSDSSLVRVIHHYVKPDPFKSNPKQHKLSDQHYWTVEGIFATGFKAKGRFNYDGNKNLSGTYAYMDTLLTAVNSDSMALFYRSGPAQDWQWLKNTTRLQLGLRTGYIETDDLKPGEYTFGNPGDTSSASLPKLLPNEGEVRIYPNPSGSEFIVEFGTFEPGRYTLNLITSDGRIVYTDSLQYNSRTIDIRQFAKGVYFAEIRDGSKIRHSQKVVID